MTGDPRRIRRWITAGAGSGKTESLVREILAALDAGYESREILALTFTRAAAAELKQRVRVRLLARRARGASGAPPDLEALTVATFHAFALGFLREEFARDGRSLALELADAVEHEAQERDRVGAFIRLRAARAPERWARLLALRGLAGAREALELALRGAARDPAAFAAALSTLDPAADADTRSSLAAEALARLEDPELGALRVGGPYRGWIDAVRGDLAALIRREWPEFPRRTREMKFSDAHQPGDFPPRLKTKIVKAAKAADRCLQGLLLEAALEPILPEVSACMAERRERLLATARPSYDEVIALTAERLADPESARRVAARHPCLLVDEAQDTDPVQARFVAALHRALDGRSRIVVVGDEKQSIYRFRNADPASYRALHGELGAPTPEPLPDNYRSVPEILAFVHEFAGRGGFEPQHSEDALEKLAEAGDAPLVLDPPFWNPGAALAAARPPAGEPRVLLFEGEAPALLAWAADWLKAPERALDWDDCLFLAHSHDKLDEIQHACVRGNIPVIRTGAGLWARELPGALLNAAEAAADPENDAALLAALRSPLFAVSDDDLLAAATSAGALGRVRDLPRGDLPPALADALARLDRLHADPAPVAVRLRRLCAEAGVDAALHDTNFPAGAAEREALTMTLRLAADAAGLSDFAGRVRRRREADESVALRPDPARPGAKLLTLHGAKGLGERVVFLDLRFDFTSRIRDQFVFDAAGWACFDGTLQVGTPGWQGTRDAAERAAGARDRAALAYVGLTRAKDWLILWAPRLHQYDSPGRLQDRLPILMGWRRGKGGDDPVRETAAPFAALTRLVEFAPGEPAPAEPIPVPDPPLDRPAGPALAESLRQETPGARFELSDTYQRGRMIHKVFERWVDFTPATLPAALAQARGELECTLELFNDVRARFETIHVAPELAALREAAAAGRLWREWPLFYPDSDVGESAPGVDAEQFWRRGIADAVYRDAAGRWVILDYKSGRWDGELLDKYRAQLADYRDALARAGCPDARLLLWFVEHEPEARELT